MSKRGGYGKLYGYVGKEYFLSFLVAFVFFFFIFFVNQILVLAQKILLKNVMLSDVHHAVQLACECKYGDRKPFLSERGAGSTLVWNTHRKDIRSNRWNLVVAVDFNFVHC